MVVAALFGGVIGRRLDTYHGKATGFVLFGRRYVQYTRPPAHTVVSSAGGYDGQFYYAQARDPLLLRDSTVANLREAKQAFRLQRFGYPVLAYAFALGHVSALPWSLLAINALVVLAVTAGFSVYAQRRGWSPWWALAVGGIAGLLTATVRDLSDPLAVGTMLGGLLLWERGRRWWAAALLSVAVLAREPMMLAVAAIAADTGLRWWRSRREPGAPSVDARHAWPAIVIPTVLFLAWQVYVDARYGGNAASTSTAFLPPFQGVVDEFDRTFHAKGWEDGVWGGVYLILMLGGIAAGIALSIRRARAASVATALFGLGLLIQVFGDPFSYTRASAPMFATLVLGGLEQRSRWALALCVAATAMTVIVPFVPWFRAA